MDDGNVFHWRWDFGSNPPRPEDQMGCEFVGGPMDGRREIAPLGWGGDDTVITRMGYLYYYDNVKGVMRSGGRDGRTLR